MKPREISEAEFIGIVSNVLGCLNGLTVGQADEVLRSASKTLAMTTVFDAGSEWLSEVIERSIASADSDAGGRSIQ